MEDPQAVQLLFEALRDDGWQWSDDSQVLINPDDPELWVGVNAVTGEFDFSDKMVEQVWKRLSQWIEQGNRHI